MKLSIFLALFHFSFVTNAIIHVGNGGGEAEMTTLKLMSGLEAWALACNENVNLCGQGIYFTAKDIAFFKSQIDFVEANQKRALCEPMKVNLVRESLYINDDIPKSMQELSSLLVKGILMCAGWPAERLAQLRLHLNLQSVQFTTFKIFGFQGVNTDLVFSPMLARAQERLIQATRCSRFRILSAVDNYFRISCLSDRQNYLILAKPTTNGFEFISRVDN